MTVSRRELLKKGAIAGAVVWSVPVIESVTSRAAAASGCVAFNASWIYVVYTYLGVTYFTGYSKADENNSGCTPGANPHNTFTVQCPPTTGTFYTLNSFTGTPTLGDVTYGPTSPGSNNAIYVGSPLCNTYLTQSGGNVRPAQAGVTIVAAFCFGSSNLTGGCPSGNNSTCANCG